MPRTLATYPMHFGSEGEYRTALQEIEWLKSIDKLTDAEVDAISAKYRLPVTFLKEKLQFPHDYMIMLSDWWPILCAWAAQKRRMYRDLLDAYAGRLNADKLKIWLFVLGTVVAVAMLLVALPQSLSPFPLVKLDPSELFSFFIFPYVLTFAVVYYHTILYTREKIDELGATINYAMDLGYGQMVKDAHHFVNQQIKKIGSALLFADSDRLFHRTAPEIYGYYLGKNPDGSPLVVAENPDELCLDRIRKLQETIESRDNASKTEKNGQTPRSSC